MAKAVKVRRGLAAPSALSDHCPQCGESCSAADVHFPILTVAYKLLYNVLWLALHILICNVHKPRYSIP